MKTGPTPYGEDGGGGVDGGDADGEDDGGDNGGYAVADAEDNDDDISDDDDDDDDNDDDDDDNDDDDAAEDHVEDGDEIVVQMTYRVQKVWGEPSRLQPACLHSPIISVCYHCHQYYHCYLSPISICYHCHLTTTSAIIVILIPSV